MQYTVHQEDLRAVLRESIGEILVGSWPTWHGLTTVLIDFVGEMLTAPGFKIRYVGRNRSVERVFVRDVRQRLMEMNPGTVLRAPNNLETTAVMGGSVLKTGLGRGMSASILIVDGPATAEQITEFVIPICRSRSMTMIAFNCEGLDEIATKTYKVSLAP